MEHPLDFPYNWIEREFGCSFVALRGKTVRVVLDGSPDRFAVFLGLLTDERGDTYVVIEEGAGGLLEQVHPSRLRHVDSEL
jgi:hypothetical protein